MAALDHVGLGCQTRLSFVCEKNVAARKLILAHQKPNIVYEDITKRPVDDMPSCDLYAVGLPCPPSAGVREGTGDRHGHRHFEHAVEYIFSKTPKCFLLESGKGLTATNYRGVFLNMLATLRSKGKYVVTWRVVNTADHGIPQNRPRLYIIGLLRSALPGNQAGFKWPRPTGCKPLSLLVDPCSAIDREQPLSNTKADENLKRLQQDLISQGFPLRSVPFALDIFSSNHIGRAMVDKVPCLT